MENSEKQHRSSVHQLVLSILGRIPYGLGAWLLGKCGAIPLIRNLILGRRRMSVLNRALPLVAPTLDLGHESVDYFSANYLMPWRANALGRCTPDELSKWVRVEGEEHFIDALGKGQGVVIMNSHTGASRLVPLVMLRRGYVVNAMEPEPWLLRMGVKGAEEINVIELRSGDNFWLKELFQAKRVLERNAILHLAVDGLQGRKGVEYAFLGKSRTFYTSFAELAVRTGAAAVPVFSTMDAQGRITVRFEPALDMGDPSAANDEQVKAMVAQYIWLLEDKWRNALGNMVAKHIHHYLQMEDWAEVDNDDYTSGAIVATR